MHDKQYLHLITAAQSIDHVRWDGGDAKLTTGVYQTGPAVMERTTVGIILMRRRATARCAIRPAILSATIIAVYQSGGCAISKMIVATIQTSYQSFAVRLGCWFLVFCVYSVRKHVLKYGQSDTGAHSIFQYFDFSV